jgi:uncharacterized protein
MRAPFELAGLKVEPGNRGSVWIDVARSPAGWTIGLPVVVVHGVGDGPVLVVDAATHGDEFEGTLSLLTLLRETDPAKLNGTLVGVPIVNGPATEAEARGNPLERHNYDMNRLFPGDVRGTISQRIAARHFEDVVKRANVVVTLHGGGNLFYLEGYVLAHSIGHGNLDLIRAFGWTRFSDDAAVAQAPRQGLLHEKCLEIGIPTITAELGGASHRSPKHLEWVKSEFLRGLRNVMIHFGMLKGQLERPATLHRIRRQLLRTNQGGIMDIEAGIDIEVSVAKGQRLVSVYSPLGELLDEVKAPFAGRIMGLPASPLAYPGRIVAAVYEITEEISTEASEHKRS